jgi:hypothetical protein
VIRVYLKNIFSDHGFGKVGREMQKKKLSVSVCTVDVQWLINDSG